MLFNESTVFRAVFGHVDRLGTYVRDVMRTPDRTTIEEVKADISCVRHHCTCLKTPRAVPCLRGAMASCQYGETEYVENDKGFRAIHTKV